MAAFFESGNEKMRELEAMVDATSLAVVLGALFVICREKADHVRANWQDESLAKSWDRAALRLNEVVGKVGV